jgi:hypothetical protein
MALVLECHINAAVCLKTIFFESIGLWSFFGSLFKINCVLKFSLPVRKCGIYFLILHFLRSKLLNIYFNITSAIKRYFCRRTPRVHLHLCAGSVARVVGVWLYFWHHDTAHRGSQEIWLPCMWAVFLPLPASMTSVSLWRSGLNLWPELKLCSSLINSGLLELNKV